MDIRKLNKTQVQAFITNYMQVREELFRMESGSLLNPWPNFFVLLCVSIS